MFSQERWAFSLKEITVLRRNKVNVLLGTITPTAARAKRHHRKAYQGATVGIADPTENWTNFAADAIGNLAQVLEPDLNDTLGRPVGMQDTGTGSNLVSSVTYGPAGELLSMTGTAVGETRTYNALGQLKSLVGLSGVSLEYTYSTSANNGQIISAAGYKCR